MEVKLYGRSDDLIEIEGDVREEFYANYNEPTRINLFGGYEVLVSYNSDGEWVIDVVEEPENADYELFGLGAGPVDYTEMLVINFELEELVNKVDR